MTSRPDLPAGFFLPGKWQIRGIVLPLPAPWRLAASICNGHDQSPGFFRDKDGYRVRHSCHFSRQAGGWYCATTPWIYYRRNISNELLTP
jgi:hypothetical protein